MKKFFDFVTIFYLDYILFIVAFIFVLTQFSSDWVYLAGLVVALVFFVLKIIARMQLGDAFSLPVRAKKIVQSGIYSKIRHPFFQPWPIWVLLCPFRCQFYTCS